MISAAGFKTAPRWRDAKRDDGVGSAGNSAPASWTRLGDSLESAEPIIVNPTETQHRASLSQLRPGTHATVTRVVSASQEIDAVALRRLGELGFLPGEPVVVLHRGPGGREPIAVLIGETMFALRLLEAQCIEVSTVVT